MKKGLVILARNITVPQNVLFLSSTLGNVIPKRRIFSAAAVSIIRSKHPCENSKAKRPALPDYSQNRFIFSKLAETLGGGPGKKLRYEEKHLLGYSMEQMYDIVSRVEKYSEFVPWCNESLVPKKTNPNSFDCKLVVGFPPLVERYTSRVTVTKPTQVEFEFRHSLHSHLAQIFFDEVIKKMVNAFFKRAESLYGSQSLKPERLKVLGSESD